MNAHWILQLNKFRDKEEYTSADFHCSNCNDIPLQGSLSYPTREYYCHNCGAHMIEEPIVEVQKYNYEAVYKWE